MIGYKNREGIKSNTMTVKLQRIKIGYNTYKGYKGLVGYKGLDILSSTALQSLVQIVRQTISHCDTLYTAYPHSTDIKVCQYRAKSTGYKRTNNIPIGITNLISWFEWFGRYEDIKV